MKKIQWAEPDISSGDKELLKQVIDSEWYSQGKYSRLLEEEICKFTGAKYAVTVNNGTSALIASLLISDLQKGDEILVPTFTFIATINSILLLGFKPVLVDCEKDTFNISVEELEKRITKKTKAVLAVDVYGMPFEIDKIKKFCEEKNLILIEDAAEALGAEYKGKKIGGFGHITIFSFHIAKICTMIEGGAITTNSEEDYKKLKMIREHGMLKKYDYEIFGLNFKSTDINCALGYNQLLRINSFLEHRQKIANRYYDNLKGLVDFQKIPDYVTMHPYMIFGTLVSEEKRDKLNQKLNELGVETRICWLPAHKQQYHSKIFNNGKFQNSEYIAERIINPPMSNRLSISDVDYICEIYNDILK
ncbi:MAG TPA: DegT/DnrJ/EryC1/StrS family aminotransferase [bacterium]|nr:DegT/DnrJ/EryC1/StrS family aminotransferase [bacterium]HOL46915.1 DegT/DnrJ/EryC1/StrS family aminotransferase [bacterium]HPQ18323.1 DegT/DnrJ/EryC1/StrS family aminotransferase [bacterium]